MAFLEQLDMLFTILLTSPWTPLTWTYGKIITIRNWILSILFRAEEPEQVEEEEEEEEEELKKTE